MSCVVLAWLVEAHNIFVKDGPSAPRPLLPPSLFMKPFGIVGVRRHERAELGHRDRWVDACPPGPSAFITADTAAGTNITIHIWAW